MLKSILFYASAIIAITKPCALSEENKPDLSFNETGFVSVDFNGRSDSLVDMAIQSDGKLLFAGQSGGTGGSDICLARYHANGTIDIGFGSSGKVIIDVGTNTADSLSGLTLLPDNKILVSGTTGVSGSRDAYVMRLHPDGTPDISFGANGKFVLDFGSSLDVCSGLAISSTGDYLISGYNQFSSSRMIIAAISPNGNLVPAFSANANFTANPPGFPDFSGLSDTCSAIHVQKNGRILLAGKAGVFESNPDFASLRYLSDGTLDDTFGIDGKTATDFFGYQDYARDIVEQVDQKIIVAGLAYSGSFGGFGILRYLPDGTLDSTFGSQGKTRYNLIVEEDGRGEANAVSLAIQEDGKILVAGSTSQSGNSTYASCGLIRLTTAGNLDETFSQNGKFISAYSSIGGNFSDATGRKVLVQPDGRILLGGTARFNINTNFLILRLNADGPDPADPFAAWAIANVPNSSERHYDDDPDHDGQTNLSEFAFGTDPMNPHQTFASPQSNGSGLPTLSLQEGVNGPFLHLWWWMTAGFSLDNKLRIGVEFSNDLVTWTSGSVAHYYDFNHQAQGKVGTWIQDNRPYDPQPQDSPAFASLIIPKNLPAAAFVSVGLLD